MLMRGLLLIFLTFSFLFPQPSMLMAAETLYAVRQSHDRSINDSRSPPVKTVKIGALAKRGKEQILQKWGPTADYLTASIPGRSFEIVPLDFTEIHEAVKEGRIDFVLANPAFYVELAKRHGVSRIATLINRNMPGQQTTTFGGVIFCRADRNDIRQLGNLKGRSFMAAEPRSFGGWIMAWLELKKIDIDPFTSFSSLQYGLTHDAVVYAVRDGKVDAGTVRSDTLERMAEAGNIKLEDFRILNRQPENSFPFMLSTDLYPEWPMAALRTTDNKLARQVASSLMAMEATHPAAIAGKCAGWTVPLNYQPVHDCLLELRISPYEDFGKFTMFDVLVHYWRQITLMALGIILIILTSLYILRLNRILQQKKEEVDDLNRNLETKVKERTHDLSKSEKKFRHFFENSKDMVYFCETGGEITDINPSGLQMLGYETQPENFNLLGFFKDTETMQQYLDGLHEHGFVSEFELQLEIQDGSTRHMLLTANAILDKDGQMIGCEGIAKDLTKIKTMTDRLISQEKMASVGQIVAGVAHEINTPLSVILGYSQLMMDDFAEDSEVYENLTVIERQTKACRKIVADLLKFSRQTETAQQELSINVIIEEVLAITEHNLNISHIHVIRKCLPDLPMVIGDTEKLRQVFINFINNSHHAMEKGGNIYIITSHDTQSHEVLATIQDTGFGISDEIKSKIFDPFFTTKAVGKGTGLGLSVSYGIIRDHGGTITVESPVHDLETGEKMQGTAFHIRLPVAAVETKAIIE